MRIQWPDMPEGFGESAEAAGSAAPALQIVPLGGLGEFGLNCMAYCYKDEILVVDCGALFPDPTLLGIDLIIPDLSFLEERRELVKALIFTHGHEDHIGAAPYFLRTFNVPVYGTPFTIELLREKLNEHECLKRSALSLNHINPGDRLQFKHMAVSFLHVNHSISEAVSLVLETPEGLLVHTGDFRIDPTPTDGRVFDYQGFASLGRKEVLALLSDSTNIERPGFTISEREVAREIEKLFCGCRQRVFVALFSSSIPRIQELVRLASAFQRKVYIAGRSLVTHTRIARERGLLEIPDSMVITLDEVQRLPPEQVMVIMTGSQGEPRSVLARVAMNDHKDLHIQPGDVVILSARVIPGHERFVMNIINHLALRGAEVYYERNHCVHTSGHAHRGEQATMLNLVQPRYFIPIHGEHWHLREHGRLAVDCGVAPERVLLAQSGSVVEFRNGVGRIARTVPTGLVFVHGKGVGDVGIEEIRERRKLGETGIILVILVIRQATGEILYGPEILSKGFAFEQVSEKLFEEGKAEVLRALASFNPESKADLEEVREEIRLVLRRFLHRELERKPVVIPIVMGM